MTSKCNSIRADDGREIPVYRWDPPGAPRAIIQILHGLGEHAGRYQRFARDCNDVGFSVIAHDHRGHGVTDTNPEHGFFADREGWDRVIADVQLVQRSIVESAGAVPLVLFGHSMGSYIAQSFVMRHPERVVMLVLSGSTFAPRSRLLLGHWLAALLSATSGGRSKSPLLDKAGFGAFNRRFQPSRTDYDWLSRDEAEVDGYIEDARCGGPFTNRLWRDLTGGLLEISSRDAVSRIPAELPVLILGGENDPVGGKAGLQALHDVYRETGHRHVELKIYVGGRHEMLNETNRDEVTADVIGWIASQLATDTA